MVMPKEIIKLQLLSSFLIFSLKSNVKVGDMLSFSNNHDACCLLLERLTWCCLSSMTETNKNSFGILTGYLEGPNTYSAAGPDILAVTKRHHVQQEVIIELFYSMPRCSIIRPRFEDPQFPSGSPIRVLPIDWLSERSTKLSTHHQLKRNVLSVMTSKKDQSNQDGEMPNLHSLQFPWKLHKLLDEAERNGDSDIISWLPGDKAFKVHSREEFARRIMPAYFSSAKYKTFQRSLNLWGFESVSKGQDKGACFHKFFVRGHPSLCDNMRRVKIKGQQLHASPTKPKDAAPVASAAPSPSAGRGPSEKPAISDFIRGCRSSSEKVLASSDQRVTPSSLSFLESDLILKAAFERQRNEALLRLQLQSTMPSLNYGSLSSFMPPIPGMHRGFQDTDPMQTVALAVQLASNVIHEV
eukprot:scaffold9079_cov120-Cylindrotheca_fusiformis.AAC.14